MALNLINQLMNFITQEFLPHKEQVLGIMLKPAVLVDGYGNLVTVKLLKKNGILKMLIGVCLLKIFLENVFKPLQ